MTSFGYWFFSHIDLHRHHVFVDAILSPIGPQLEQEKIYWTPQNDPERYNKPVAEKRAEKRGQKRSSLQKL